jgi:hypothetical protein
MPGRGDDGNSAAAVASPKRAGDRWEPGGEVVAEILPEPLPEPECTLRSRRSRVPPVIAEGRSARP